LNERIDNSSGLIIAEDNDLVNLKPEALPLFKAAKYDQCPLRVREIKCLFAAASSQDATA
jgi:hypothetical protein